jgi:hypothetical protein
MGYVVVAALVASVACESVRAQEAIKAHQFSSPPANARFEVVGSPIAAKWTFRLDRATGHVAQLVSTPSGGTTWEEMLVLKLPTVPQPGKPRFQIFSSGLAAKWTFLIDTATGNTWQMVQNGDSTLWEPFD